MTLTDTTPAAPPQRRRRPRPRPAGPALPDWSCENCAQPNAGRRRRCLDCGTSRE